MSNNIKSISIAASILVAAALVISASPAMAQRPAGGQSEPQRPPPAQPPPATRPQTPPPPPPTDTTREEKARAEQQREVNARTQQQQDQQRAEKARQEQAAKDQERIARARQETATTTADPKLRDIIARLMAAEKIHRQQLASINRLKQIAQRQEQTERIGELDQLLQGSNTNFDRVLLAAKAELPADQYNNTVKMLEQGRRREVRQMMGQNGDAPDTGRTPPANGVQKPERAPAPSRQKAPEPVRPPH